MDITSHTLEASCQSSHEPEILDHNGNINEGVLGRTVFALFFILALLGYS